MRAAASQWESEICKGAIRAGMTFQQKVWAVTARIPRGKVVTYGDVARQLKSTGYRAVGAALHCNPFAPKVPCHRVVGSDGKLTGFAMGLAAKKRMLEEEGIQIKGSKVDLGRYRAAL